ncbi:MAG: oligosaccharide flippase family protein [Anaerolineae bacterium]
MSGLQRLPRNTLVLTASNLGGALLSFVLTALIGRALGADGLGAYAAALAWIWPLALLVDFGLAPQMTRDLARAPENSGDALRLAVAQRLLFGLPVLFGLLVLAPLAENPTLTAGLHLSAPLVIILPLVSTFTAIFKAHGRMAPVLWLNVGMLVAQVVLTIAVFAAGGGVLAALAVNVLTSAGQLAAAWLIYHRSFRTPSHEPITLRPIWQVSRAAFPFALAAVFAALQLRLTLILLESLSGSGQVGYFTAASRFTEAARLVPNAYFGALFPALAALAVDRALLERTFRRAALGLAGYGLLAGIGFTLLAAPLMTLVFSQEFAPAAPVLAALGWSLGLSLVRGGRTLYWYARGAESAVNIVNGGVLLLQVVLCVALLPSGGALAAAWIQVAIEAVALALLWTRLMPRRATLAPTHEPVAAA